MHSSKRIVVWIVVWSVVATFWLFVTKSFHPTWTLACIVTASLIGSYGVASYVHQLVLIPSYWRTGKRSTYWALLLTTMLGLTALALAVIRISYLHWFGPYPVNYWYIDYAIDLFGMVVHVVGAMATTAAFRRLTFNGTNRAEP